jgi:hypothetical protein
MTLLQCVSHTDYSVYEKSGSEFQNCEQTSGTKHILIWEIPVTKIHNYLCGNHTEFHQNHIWGSEVKTNDCFGGGKKNETTLCTQGRYRWQCIRVYMTFFVWRKLEYRLKNLPLPTSATQDKTGRISWPNWQKIEHTYTRPAMKWRDVQHAESHCACVYMCAYLSVSLLTFQTANLRKRQIISQTIIF